jgi:lysophospholipase
MILRFADQQAFRRMRPERCLGSPSWHWVAEAFGATAALRDDPGLARIETPVLMLVAQADRLVDARAPARGGADAERHFGLFRPGCAHECCARPIRSAPAPGGDRCLSGAAGGGAG